MKEIVVRPVEEHNAEHDADDRTQFGFWVYVMTDCVLFATLFATFAVLRNNTYGGESGHELFSLPFVLTETLILLTSSFTCGLALLAVRARQTRHVIGWLAVTFLLGVAFLGMELSEFAKLADEGNSWTRSAFLSSFFTLVGTHGLHIASGLIWMLVMIVQVARRGLIRPITRKLALLGIFWHFLDVVWIFIFSVVYLWGAI